MKQPKRTGRLELAQGSQIRLYVRFDDSSNEAHDRDFRQVATTLRFWAGELEKMVEAGDEVDPVS